MKLILPHPFTKTLPQIAVITLAMLAACGPGKKNSEKKQQTVSVEVMIAGDETLASDIEVNGNVLPLEMVELHPEISGRLTFLNMPDGAEVLAGTVLARINDADLQAQLRQQQVQLELAKKTEQRLNKLLAVNGVNQAEYDAALSQVNLYNANVEVLNAQIDKTVIRAPFTGRLGLRQVSPGAYVTPATLLGTLQMTDAVKIDFTVPESYSRLINKGSEVIIKPVNGDSSLPAVIQALEPRVNTSSRSLKARAVLSKGLLTPGSFVKVKLDNSIRGIVVPTQAIIPDALSNLVVVVKNGKAVFRNIQTGVRTASLVEVTSGLNTGDSVVTSGVLFVRPGSVVKIKAVKKTGEPSGTNRK